MTKNVELQEMDWKEGVSLVAKTCLVYSGRDLSKTAVTWGAALLWLTETQLQSTAAVNMSGVTPELARYTGCPQCVDVKCVMQRLQTLQKQGSTIDKWWWNCCQSSIYEVLGRLCIPLENSHSDAFAGDAGTGSLLQQSMSNVWD